MTSNILVEVPHEEFRDRRVATKLAEIDPSLISDGIKTLVDGLGNSLKKNPFSSADFKVEKIVLNLGVSGEGKVSILGSGVKAGAEASIQIHVAFGGDN